MTIVSVKIIPDPSWVAIGMDEPKQVHATFEDGTQEVLFSYYSDELTFTEAEFVGMTREQARQLHLQRDMEYLRS